MPTRDDLGGIVHSYQRYDPARIPSPRPADVDLVSPAMEHLLEFGELDDLSPEQLAGAVLLDPEQIRGFGPSIESLRRMLEARKRKILEHWDAAGARKRARTAFREAAAKVKPPAKHKDLFHRAVREEQLRLLERLWYAQDDDQSRFGADLVGLVDLLGSVYQIDELATKWAFTGREKLGIEEALRVKEELEEIDRLLAQLADAQKNARVGLIDLDALGRYAADGELDDLARLKAQVEEMVQRMAAEQGLDKGKKGYSLSPKAMRLFQGKLLEKIFSALDPSRTGRHQVNVTGEGAVELVPTRPYEFGDSVAHIDIPGSLVNAMLRQGKERPLRLDARDIEVHTTRNTPKCATVVALDMSGSMRHGGLYVSVKRMALALQGLVQREFPGDTLSFLEMYSFAKPRPAGEIVTLLPKPVTIFEPVVRLRADMSDPAITAEDVPPHFTNIQHALQLARRQLARADTPNKQVILITDGLPTAHFEGNQLYLLYPPHKRTEEATLREAEACRREGIVVNVFLLSGWSQSREDIQFAYKLAQTAQGRVFFTSGKDLDRFVVWDYVSRRRSIIG
ncbi:MAG: VWA domain-containing protein [Planctomycetota bacterium]|nr:MAG: VWA domain-containing protein [Planctomycetota bacterium]